MGKYNLSYEKRLLDLLGYSYQEDIPGRWIIIDDNKKNVGYIETTPIDNSKTNPYEIKNDYYYHMVINSDTVVYDDTRDFDYELYDFIVKNVGTVHLQLGKWHRSLPGYVLTIIGEDKYSSMCIQHEFGRSELGVLEAYTNGIMMNYDYIINGYKVSETVKFRNKDFDKKTNWIKAYEYCLGYYKKENESSKYEGGYRLFAYSFIKNPKDLEIEMKAIGEIDSFGDIEPTSAKTPEEFAIEHGRGLELFKMGRKYINEVLPFKKDILYEYFKKYIDEYNLEVLFDDEKQKTK